MKKLLCIVGGMNSGGAETFLMKVFRALDKTKYIIDFAVGFEEEGYYDKEIQALGGRIYHIIPKTKGVLKNFNSVKDLVRTGHYENVLRLSQNSLSAFELVAAKIGGAKNCAYRSSNSDCCGSAVQKAIHIFCKPLSMYVPDTKIAPSTEAGKFMFGNTKFSVLHNALDLGVYRYSEDSRAKIRREFGLEDKLVVGHVGRLTKQKNHEFLLDVFQKIREKRSDAVLLLVGKGELQEAVKSKAEALGLADRVIFAGVRADVPALLAAMDVFVFPSFYEGMPNTVIEAQAVGLPCVIADTITKEAQITDLVKYMSLKQSADVWAEQALVEAGRPVDRLIYTEVVRKAGYDIAEVVKEFQKLVFGE